MTCASRKGEIYRFCETPAKASVKDASTSPVALRTTRGLGVTFSEAPRLGFSVNRSGISGPRSGRHRALRQVTEGETPCHVGLANIIRIGLEAKQADLVDQGLPDKLTLGLKPPPRCRAHCQAQLGRHPNSHDIRGHVS